MFRVLVDGPGAGEERLRATGTHLVSLITLNDGGYVAIGPAGYKLQGDPTGRLWWAIKLCRFAPGELDSHVPGIRRLSAEERFWPASPSP